MNYVINHLLPYTTRAITNTTYIHMTFHAPAWYTTTISDLTFLGNYNLLYIIITHCVGPMASNGRRSGDHRVTRHVAIAENSDVYLLVKFDTDLV